MVTGSEHSEDELKGDEEFYNQRVSHGDAFIHLCEKDNSLSHLLLPSQYALLQRNE